ncbi:L-type lectin-domain containing receptor kinase VII.1-like [Salvia miltiorrhiza]|uniref:L-type lectin-domain containing receptor kinase VII.1-like n=1 Tax=Salvia miltiorrhiza TaxID=226208 RepID=UPI0025ABCA9C|nr:L-type lectin-domain containing receptor kinase VII.1-like [Salvia miltiorrhiza]
MKKLIHRLILATIFTAHLTSAVDFLFNGFDDSAVSYYGNATLDSRILSLTGDAGFEIGRALYPSKIPTKDPNTSLVLPFSTSFIFAMAPFAGRLAGHGMVFLFVPYAGIDDGIESASSQNLGFLNFSNNGDPNNHVFGVEFDVFRNQEFDDINANHVGIDVNSLTSLNSSEAGYWSAGNSFEQLDLNNGRTYQVWIDYTDGVLSVTMAPVGVTRPRQPLLNVSIDLSQVLEDQMYVGFTASTGNMTQSHKILAWSYSNTNFSLSEGLITAGLPSFELPETPFYRTRGFIAGLTAGVLILGVVCCANVFLFVRKSRRERREREEMEDWEMEYWPHRLSYQEIDSATKGFADENVIGIGGNGKVYRGVLNGGLEVAVKRISHENAEGMRAFLAEISSLGRVKHRNLVGLRGWCKKEKGSLILVYDFMENGSLDQRVFECDVSKMLGFENRIRVLREVASGILYLHEGWESKVLHRDIKASNVLLDRDMNARLGDFGLARMHDHDKAAGTTQVVGTIGYLAPEVVKTGRASTQADVFGYGALILEVMCGRRPIEAGKPPLVDWVWEMFRRGELVNVVDARLRGEVEAEEAERVLQLGLVCAHPDSKARPTMRQVVKVFEGRNEVEGEGEDMSVYLLEKMRNGEVFPMHLGNGFGLHPTLDEIRQGMSSTMSLSWSDITVVEGR